MFAIKVKTIKTDEFELKVRPTERIGDLKERIAVHTHLQKDSQNLLFKGILLKDDETVGHYGIAEGNRVDLVPSVDAEN